MDFDKLKRVQEGNSKIKEVDKQAQLQAIVNDHLFKLGINSKAVTVKVTNLPYNVGGARGLRFDGIPVLGNIAFGEILIDKDWINILSKEELEFVLAHEVSHIYCDHYISAVLFKWLSTKIEASKKSDKHGNLVQFIDSSVQIIELIKYIQSGELPIRASITKQEEIEADYLAIKNLTRNKISAKSCLKKFVNNDLSKPSHIWEANIGKISLYEGTVMTMKERIDEIEKINLNDEKPIPYKVESHNYDIEPQLRPGRVIIPVKNQLTGGF